MELFDLLELTKYKIILILISCILSSTEYNTIKLYSSNIYLKIRGTGTYSVYYSGFNSKPSEIYINGEKQKNVNNQYYFSKYDNTVELIYDYNLTSCERMFHNLENIIEIDMSHFIASKVTTMNCMFCDIHSVEFINLTNLDISQVTDMWALFDDCWSLTSVNIANFETSKVTNINSMFNSCKSLKYINIKNVNNNNHLNSIDRFFFEVPTDAIICIDDYGNNKVSNLIGSRKKFNSSYTICKCDLSETINKPINSYNTGLCMKCNDNFYPKENDTLNKGIYINCYQNPEGYILDIIDKIYIKCYSSCETCERKGNKINHNCLKCKSNYTFEMNINNYKNCYENCTYYYYFDEEYNYRCTKYDKCPINFSKLISEQRRCIKDCSLDSIYKYEYNNKCYIECPFSNYELINNTYCNMICFKDKPFENKLLYECVKFCGIKDMIQNFCILKYNTNITGEEKEDFILRSVELGIISSNYNTSDIENGKDDIIETDKMKIFITTSENQNKNIDNNISTINLGECEKKLRKYYNISKNNKLYMKKIDVIQIGFQIDKIEFDIYAKLNGTNLEILDKSLCKTTKISIYIPIQITENIDKLNMSSGYFNDLCYISQTNFGTDISLNDRKNEFIDNNKMVCQDECDLSEYNTKKVSCLCNIQETHFSFSDMKINKTKLKENFINIKNIANINLLKCYKILFTIQGLLYNMGSYIILPIIIINIICIIIYITKESKKISEKIEIIANLIDKNDCSKLGKKEPKKLKLNKNESQKIKINKIKSKKHRKKKNQLNKNKINNISAKSNNDNSTKKTMMKKNQLKNKDIISNNITTKKKHSKRKETKFKNISTILNNVINKTNNYLSLTDNEINSLPYKKALLKDNRTYCQYYISLLKTKHIIFFTYFNNRDYNAKSIKIDLFFINFAIYFTINTLFFNDNTIHQIYKSKGSFDFEYQLPKIIYSSLISTALNTLLKLFALSNEIILEFKNSSLKNNIIIRKKDLKFKIKIKFILFVISSFFLLPLFWYYISMFCAIYKNTSYHLVKDTGISFALSFLYPFGIFIVWLI